MARECIRKIHAEWQGLMKNLNRMSATNLTNLKLFKECLSEWSIFQPRDDYRELLELYIIFVGESRLEECVLAVMG